MKRRTVWTVLWAVFLVSTKLLFATLLFAALVYAVAVLGYWFAGAYLYD